MTPARRDPNLDLVKTVAMLCVIGLHTTTSRPDYGVYYRSCVVAVPLFFMVAGWLLLPKPSLDWAYVWRKIRAILRVVFLGFTIIYIFDNVTEGWPVPPAEVPVHYVTQFLLCFLHRDQYTNLWFFGALIMLYLVAPPLGRVYRERPRTFAWVFAGACALSLIMCAVNNAPVYYLHGLEWPFEENIPQTLRVWNWLFFFTLGAMLRRPGVLEALRPWCGPAAIAALLLANNLWQVKLDLNYYGQYMCEYYYTLPVTQMLCVAVFVWLMGVRLPRPCRPLQEVAPLFVPVYLFHLELVFYFQTRVESTLAVWAIAAALSIGLSYLAMRIPLLRRAFTI